MDNFKDFSVVEHGVDNLFRKVCKVVYLPTQEEYLLSDAGFPSEDAPVKRRLVVYKTNNIPADPALSVKIKEVARAFFDEQEQAQS